MVPNNHLRNHHTFRISLSSCWKRSPLWIGTLNFLSLLNIVALHGLLWSEMPHWKQQNGRVLQAFYEHSGRDSGLTDPKLSHASDTKNGGAWSWYPSFLSLWNQLEGSSIGRHSYRAFLSPCLKKPTEHWKR